jgi:CPA2 family monovalent cation:H+ antiporter-2
MASVIETAPLVLNVGVVLTAAATMGFLARKIGLPSVIGYLVTGLLVSPFTPGFIAENNQLALLADIGVVLLLFEVGIELDLKRISREQKTLLWRTYTVDIWIINWNTNFRLVWYFVIWLIDTCLIYCNVIERGNC